MKKRHFLFPALFLCSITLLLFCNFRVRSEAAGQGAGSVYDKWPQARFRNFRVLLATDSELACRGFAIASHEDFENTIIIFPNIRENTVFINRDQGFGAVKRDLKIVFLDSGMKVLKEDIMKKGDGYSVAPSGARFAIEGLAP